MRQINSYKKIDALSKAYCYDAAAALIEKLTKETSEATYYLIQYQFSESLADTKKTDLLAICGFLLEETFLSTDIITRVGYTAFFVYALGKKTKAEIYKTIEVYQHQLHKQGIKEDQLTLRIGITFSQHETTLQKMLQTSQEALSIARQQSTMLHILDGQKTPSCTASYPRPFPPFQISQKDADPAFIFQMTQLLYQEKCIQDALDQVIKSACSYFHVHHAYVAFKDRQHQEYRVSHEHIFCKMPVINYNLQKMPALLGDHYEAIFNEQKVIICNRLEELKRYDVFMEQRQRLRGGKALMQCAIYELDNYVGYITFLDCEKERVWSRQDTATFLCLSQILSIALLLERSRQSAAELIQYDHLTNARNLNEFISIAEQDIQQSQEDIAILTLDVVNFKMINSDFGYAFGNSILIAMSQTLGLFIQSDEIFARMDADNFILLLHYDTYDRLQQRLKNLIHRLDQLTNVHHFTMQLACRIGVYLVNDVSLPINTMIDYANSARKQTKNHHKSGYTFFNNQAEQRQREEHHMVQEIMQALKQKDFVVYYQPKIHVQSGRCIGLEALSRWNHKQKGIISPDVFIPLFEKNGLISELDMYVLEQVCLQLKRWMAEGKEPLPIAVNISRIHLKDSDIINEIMKLCRQQAIPRKLIEFEITENALLEDMEDVMSKALQLKKAGFTLSMDDFGTGYSSLSILKNLPVDIIKLDREFFQKVMNQREKIIISNIIHMAKQLNIQVISEGIETKEHIQFLREIGCNLAQGFYFSKPKPIEELNDLLWTAFPMGDLL